MHIAQLPPAPNDPSNLVENTPAAAALGKKLFFDRRFSSNQAVSCASCHDPDKQFQDGRPVGTGVGTSARRTMPVVAAGHSPWLFWDGRKDSVWSQALGPLEDAAEHGGNRLQYAHLMATHYRRDYEASFGKLPELADLPRDASPLGSRAEKMAWNAIVPKTQDNVSRIFANMGKALAAYQKTLQYGAARLDRYIDGVQSGDIAALQILNPQEKNGLRIFIGRGECITCHNGPLLTDQHFHNTGVPSRNPEQPDIGRGGATAKVLQDEFNCLGRYSDAKPEHCQELRFMATDDPHLAGAFKTPALRNVALRSPYMHAGQLASLTDVVRHYVKAPAAVLGHSERQPMNLSETEIRDLAAFLATLSGQIVESGVK
ncbi:cytochrome-c peroxidase [Actimicrobium sp. GrIS 1.19]|uniref:cytochrome-c peroxidase n=1 Tax=Actimicrobium sp. GrIS 1.19 TaxID=3071708 RepID=UPI002E0E9D82